MIEILAYAFGYWLVGSILAVMYLKHVDKARSDEALILMAAWILIIVLALICLPIIVAKKRYGRPS